MKAETKDRIMMVFIVIFSIIGISVSSMANYALGLQKGIEIHREEDTIVQRQLNISLMQLLKETRSKCKEWVKEEE